jgi:hypothetical protein
MHDEQLNAVLPPLAEKDVLRSDLSAMARRFIRGRPDLELRALAAGLGLEFLSALRQASAAGTRLLGQNTNREAGRSSARFRAGKSVARSPERAIFAAVENAEKFIDRFGGFSAAPEQPLNHVIRFGELRATAAQGVNDSWLFLVRRRFWEYLPAASTDDRLRLLEQLAPEATHAADDPHSDSATPLQPTGDPFPLSFENGAFRYKGGAPQELGGKPLQVLRQLAVAPGHSLSIKELQKIVWGYDEKKHRIYEEAIRSAVYEARKALRSAMTDAGEIGSGDSFDPIPCVDKKPNLAWKLEFPSR